MPRFLPDMQKIIHDADMKRVLKAVFLLVGGEKKMSKRVASALAKTLKKYDNEACWKDIILYSPLAIEVCDLLEEGVV